MGCRGVVGVGEAGDSAGLKQEACCPGCLGGPAKLKACQHRPSEPEMGAAADWAAGRSTAFLLQGGMHAAVCKMNDASPVWEEQWLSSWRSSSILICASIARDEWCCGQLACFMQ